MHFDIAELLIRHGANIHQQHQGGYSPLYVAASVRQYFFYF